MGSGDDEIRLLHKGMLIAQFSAGFISFMVLLLIIFMYVVNIATIYYVSNLEDETCNCVRDWRHNFIKYIAILNIILPPLFYLINNKYIAYKSIIISILHILTCIMYFVFVSYVKDLETNKCECAISKQKKLNNFLYKYYNILSIITLVVLILLPIIVVVSGIIMISKI